MQKVASSNGYDYYTGQDEKGTFYNIVPEGQPAPNGGYTKEYILKIKNVPDLFPYSEGEVFNHLVKKLQK